MLGNIESSKNYSLQYVACGNGVRLDRREKAGYNMPECVLTNWQVTHNGARRYI